MKLFVAFLGGFGLTLLSFGGGVLLAITYFSAEPVHRPGPSADTAATWPSEPVKVEDTSGLERLPDRPVSPLAPKQIEAAAGGQSETAAEETAEEALDESLIEVDGLTTAALTASEAPEDEPARDEHRVTIMDAHVEWCADRYRSYRAGDNSYQPYGAAGRTPCVSPFFSDDGGTQTGEFSDEVAEDDHPAQDEPVFIVETVDGGPVMTRDHIQACFDRYRSYRPEDNSYQPYGGGPRRQCE